MRDPNVMRYASPSQERTETIPKLNPFNSPLNTLTRKSATAPASISMPVPSRVDFGISAPFAYIEPMDQNNAAQSSKRIPNVLKLVPPPVSSAGPTRMNTPRNPTNKPRMACHEGFAPPDRKDSNKVSQNGEGRIISAAMPEGTCCSAQPTRPLPPSNKAAPTIAVDFQLLRVGAGSPAARRQI